MKKPNPQIVTAAVIVKDGHILIARRTRGLHAGTWEFPGGTLEEGETHEQCLIRELQEELSVAAEIGDLICSIEHTYTPDWTVRLLLYRATVAGSTFSLTDHDEIRWVKPEDLVNYHFPDVAGPIVQRLAANHCT